MLIVEVLLCSLFYGYQYNGAEFVPGELNKEVAAFQLKYLVEHEEWLSEDEARVFLSQGVYA